MQKTLTILGAGSSAGTPVVGCKCETCISVNPRNKRTRCSSLITLENGKNILIDTSPDLREQSIRESVTNVDAVLFTHAHADHCHGIDDLRAFCQINKIQIPLYGNEDVIDQLVNKFKYAMIEPKNFWEIPVLKPNIVNAPFEIFNEIITPIPVKHGNYSINGYRVGNLGYITDVSEISENSMKLLEGIDVLLLDCLRMEPHFTHLCFSESIEIAKKINAKETYLIHMTHSLEYESLKKMLPEGIYVGYDGLKLQIN
jgi:phosphoribosyl 1,2-cyclic phosphate phosphodiesterase|tara:strand:- start:402 stop:1172 length:771 start_codon:yes stop_codon:yes gene_type:complete